MKKIIVDNKNATTAEEKIINVDAAVKLFKRRVNNEGILQECRKREFYEKPGVRRRHKHEAALKARRKLKRK